MSAALKLLLIDDNDDDRAHFKDCLKLSGVNAEVMEAEDGKEGVALYKSQPADCVLLDYQMPGRNGVQILSDLKRMDRHVPVVMLTGQGSEDVAVKAMKEGAQDYLNKGMINPESLLHVIMNVIDRAAMLRRIAEQREELENFAIVLAHDLSAPVHVMRKYAEMIVADAEKSGNLNREEIARYSKSVMQGADRMMSLIDALSEYAQLYGDIPVNMVAMDYVVQAALSNLELKIKEHKAMITHDKMPEIIGNSPLLIQLMQNLIGNAIKYCEKKPVIHIGAVKDLKDGWIFSVKDNGIGIPERQYRQVFMLFQRVDPDNKYEGMGVGLATCKKIVEKHNGRIWCVSTEGQGTTFSFTLPQDQHYV